MTVEREDDQLDSSQEDHVYRPQMPYTVAMEMVRLLKVTVMPRSEETGDAWFAQGQLDSLSDSLIPVGINSTENTVGVSVKKREELEQLLEEARQNIAGLLGEYGAGDLSEAYPLTTAQAEGRIAGIEWVLGSRETLERVQQATQV